MPREKQKRGRRAEEKSKKDVSKRKRDEAPEDSVPKRLKSGDEVEDALMQEAPDYIPLDENYDNEQPHESGSD